MTDRSDWAALGPFGGDVQAVAISDNVVDVTATQFGDYPKVVVRPYRADEVEDFWIVGSVLDMPGSVNRFNEVIEKAEIDGRTRKRIGFEMPDETLLHLIKEFYDGAWFGGPFGRIAEKTLGMSCRALRRAR